MASTHPEFEELLLWQSGELEPADAARITEHLKSCLPCQEELNGVESLKERVVGVNTAAAQRSFHAAFEQRQRPLWRRAFASLVVPRFGMAAVASVLIVTLVILSLTEFTPAARADTLLNRAMEAQQTDSGSAHFLRIHTATFQCSLSLEREASRADASVTQDQKNCQILTKTFHSVGWTENDLLSAKSFQQWRKGLHQKRDSIHRLADAVEVTTHTDAGEIRSATLRLRSSDYRPIYGKFEFAPDTHEDAVEVIESVPARPEPSLVTMPAVQKTLPRSAPVQPRFVDPLDAAEAQVRLALHQAGVDQDVLVAVERQAMTIKLWGVAPTERLRQQLVDDLKDQANVVLALQTESSQEQGSLPWQAYRGDSPPLALDTLQTLYPSDIEGRQKLLNTVDQTSRQIIAEARSRDALLHLAQRIQPADTAQADVLRSAAAGLESSMLADLSVLRNRLQPVIGATRGTVHVLNERQAMRLYLRLHEVLFQAKSSDSSNLDTAEGEIRGLLG